MLPRSVAPALAASASVGVVVSGVEVVSVVVSGCGSVSAGESSVTSTV